MADYKKMYAILCGAIDDEIDALEKIPLATPSANRLKNALLKAEEIYITSEPYVENSVNAIELKKDV